MANEILKDLNDFSLKEELKKFEEKGTHLKSILMGREKIEWQSGSLLNEKPIITYIKKMSKQYRYNLSFAEKIDRLNICQAKENYSGTDKYAQEIQDILHDIQIDLDNGIVVTADMIRAIVVLTQSNLAIWLGEDDVRKGTSTKSDTEIAAALTQTHLLNGSRSRAKTWIQNLIGGRTDEKIACLAENSAWKITIKQEENEQWRYM